MLKDCTLKLIQGEDLTEEEAYHAMNTVMEGDATPVQLAGFLTALRVKGERVGELAGCARAMREKASRVTSRHKKLVDTCGTGGDGSGTFNISTTAAFVVAGAGLPVAKHGNRSVTSQSGSADVMEALGVRVDATPVEVGRCLDELGIGFLFAPSLHGAMKYAVGTRRELGFRTIFNLLGPLTNPAGAQAQLVGVFHPELTELVAQVLERLGTKRALVVHGLDGLDEVSVAGPTKVSELNRGRIETYFFSPEEYGIPRAPQAALRGGGAPINGAITMEVLQGKGGPRRDVVLLNAAAALLAGDRVQNFREGLARGREAIDSGSALAKLELLGQYLKKGDSLCS